MYTLTDKLYESLLDDEDDLISSDNSVIEQFLKDNYEIIGSYKIINKVVNVMGDIRLINKNATELTNKLFSFGKISGKFICSNSNINTLIGGPYETKSFSCVNCINLKSLKGAPKTTVIFNCSHCERIQNLKFSPKIVDDFLCNFCVKLQSLEGAPKIVKGDFECNRCPSLKNLDYLPYINGDLTCDERFIDKIKNNEININVIGEIYSL